MYRGKNPSALRSQDCIIQTCMRLMEVMPIQQITILQIMQESDLSRQTFYQLFDSKDEILECYLDRIFIEYMEEISFDTVNDLCGAAKIFFKFFDQQKPFVRLLIQNEKTYILQRKCRKYLQDDNYINYQPDFIRSEKERDFIINFVISGMVGMLVQWLEMETGLKPDAEELALLVCRITGSETENAIS